jgi:cell growth-regulating nucleolar protein
MVFFVCEGCNESLKKNQVDKHANRCRNCHAVTCVDCQVTFWGNDYAVHTSCVSEAEKYEGSLYKAKAKKMTPQEAWQDVVETACSLHSEANTPTSIQPLLLKMSDLSNVPRQKKKFVNFLKNSLRLYDDRLVDQCWDFISKISDKRKEEADSAAAAAATVATATAEEKAAPVTEKVSESIKDDDDDKAKERKAAKKAKKAAKEAKSAGTSSDGNNDEDSVSESRKRSHSDSLAVSESEKSSKKSKKEKKEKKEKKSKKDKK